MDHGEDRSDADLLAATAVEADAFAVFYRRQIVITAHFRDGSSKVADRFELGGV